MVSVMGSLSLSLSLSLSELLQLVGTVLSLIPRPRTEPGNEASTVLHQATHKTQKASEMIHMAWV